MPVCDWSIRGRPLTLTHGSEGDTFLNVPLSCKTLPKPATYFTKRLTRKIIYEHFRINYNQMKKKRKICDIQ